MKNEKVQVLKLALASFGLKETVRNKLPDFYLACFTSLKRKLES